MRRRGLRFGHVQQDARGLNDMTSARRHHSVTVSACSLMLGVREDASFLHCMLLGAALGREGLAGTQILQIEMLQCATSKG